MDNELSTAKWLILGYFNVHIQNKLLKHTPAIAHTPVVNWVVCLGQMVSS